MSAATALWYTLGVVAGLVVAIIGICWLFQEFFKDEDTEKDY